MAHDPILPSNPTPEERAAFVMFRLEQFIREGKTIDEGMSLKRWQTMAQQEIAATILDAQRAMHQDEPITRRMLFIFGASITTIGFWGAAVSLHNVGYVVGASVCMAAGLALLAVAGEWKIRGFWRSKEAVKRRSNLAKVETLNKRVKKLLTDLEGEAESLDKALKKVRKTASAR